MPKVRTTARSSAISWKTPKLVRTSATWLRMPARPGYTSGPPPAHRRQGLARFGREQLGHLAPGLVNGRGDDMGRRFSGQLDDVLAEVRFDDLDTAFFEGAVEFGLFLNHRFFLDHRPGMGRLLDHVDDRIGLFGGAAVSNASRTSGALKPSA